MFLGIIYFIARYVLGSGDIAGAVCAVIAETTSPSARERIIYSVGAPVVTCDW